MEIRRGTTTKAKMSIDGVNPNDASVIWFTFKQGDLELTKTKGDVTISGTEVEVTLSQEETLDFKEGSVSMQLRALVNGEAVASDIKSFAVKPILKDGKIGD